MRDNLYKDWLEERINDLVDQWHSSPNIDGDSCQFLKMTQLEYKNWISYGTIPNKTERHVIKNFGEYRNE